MARATNTYDDPLARLNTSANIRKQDNARVKNFVVWDGEGVNTAGEGRPQSYVLFGAYNGKKHYAISSEHLSTVECLELIMRVGRENPNSYHVGFAFGYDTNMILRDVPPGRMRILREKGYCIIGQYKLTHIPGKWISVKDRITGQSVTIADVWGFFQSSFLAAIRSYLPGHPLMTRIDEIEQGKAKRAVFTLDDFPMIHSYWEIENELAWHLVNKLRELLYEAGLLITKWHGPGALASYVYKREGVKPHMGESIPEVYDAARYAYAGGRFERFHIGRYQSAYGYDINSAYPNAIAKLPSLASGQWIHTDRPNRIVDFGMYRVSMRGPAIRRNPGPLFHRDISGNITYPWRLENWVWGPELKALRDCLPEFRNIKVLEAWEYEEDGSRPFAFVQDMYDERRRMKAAGIGSQIALKLCLNSLYGKQAQRAGWERNNGAPPWHKLEWAGYVTSYTRAMLFRLMSSMPYDKLIAVETDGIYSTATPAELGLVQSAELGGWEISEYDEMIYLQSGMYAKREGKKWELKYRGLDANSISVEQIIQQAHLLGPGTEWPTLDGTTTRFIGYKNALFREEQNRGPFKIHHCVWETTNKSISCGDIGKRVHSPKLCAACKAGATAYEMAHETVINSKTALLTGNALMSTQHDIPWVNADQAAWRVWDENDDNERTA